MKRAFTLIELLVVITIIVVLLALLTPALDKAIYEAELAICAARVRGLAQAATVYTTDHKRRYPYREFYRSNGNHRTNRPNKLWSSSGQDNRPQIRPYVASINKQFQCPLLPEMNIDVNDIDSRPDGEAGWASYQFWYGWQYSVTEGGTSVPEAGATVGGTPRPGGKGMLKLGDRFTYTTGGREYAFDILANDYDLVSPPGAQPGFDNTAIGSHPDKAPRQVMTVSIANNEPTVVAFPEAGRNNFIWSRWQGPYLRGLIDMNFARADNAVTRYSDVVLERDPVDHTPDERMVRVPDGDADEWPGWRNHLPSY
jgi:prepilin-type N-terminal cleavage/methylation domain-containing protein